MAYSSLLLTAVVLLVCSQCYAQTPPPVEHKPGHCVWYGECGPSQKVAGGHYNCYYNGPAKNVTPGSEFQKQLESICPQYANGPVCCDSAMLNTLIGQISVPQQLFSRCPACLTNFINNFCATTCDPSAALFIDPTSIVAFNKTTWQVEAASIYITNKYGQGLFDSCKNVQNPSDNSGKVVNLMCGGASPCTRDAWFQYLGITNPYVPFPMTYYFHDNVKPDDKGILPKDSFMYPCNYHNGSDYSQQCSCTDCGTPDVCPPPPEAIPNTFPTTKVMIYIAAAGGALVLLLFLAALIAGIVQLVIKPKGYTRIGSKSRATNYGSIPEDDSESPTSSVGSINDDEIQLDTEADAANCCCYGCFKIGAYFERYIKRVFYFWGKFATRYWFIVLIAGAAIVGALCSGIYRFDVVTDTVQLWSAPNSRARTEKNFFDSHFGPFYRTEMIIIKPRDPTKYFTYGFEGHTFGPALTWEVINETFFLQKHLMEMEAPLKLDNGTVEHVTLQDICFQPLSPDNKECTIMSVINYFQNNYTRLTQPGKFGLGPAFPHHIYYCTRDPTAPVSRRVDSTEGYPCLASFGGPVDPNVALGGFNYDNDTSQWNYQNATALIITFTVNNHLDEKDNAKAEAWEKAFLDYLQNTTFHNFNVSFLSERSTVDELQRESQTDELTVIISYLFMFAYITIFLGHIRSVATILIDMKFFVGFVGVILVLGAVGSSVGLLSYIGVPGSLIILEVVPFLVLAVGVDNLFIIIHSYERQAKKFAKMFEGDLSKIPVDELIGRAVGEVAPSLLLTALSETSAFLLGGISTMPAVRSFSFYAGVAVFFNFMLQITVFVAVVALDARRQLANRFDILFCLKLKGKFNPNAGVDILHFLMKWFAKFILYPIVRPFVLALFGITTVMSIVFIFKLDIGLDQTLAFPKDSYLIPYFNDMKTYLHTGSPVYFVIKGDVNYSLPDIQNKICSQAGCQRESLGTEITVYSERSDMTRIAEPGMLWVDTYFQWISPHSGCCGLLVHPTANETYCTNPKEGTDCVPCLNETLPNSRPRPEDFKKHIKQWLKSNPNTQCAAGGHAAFGSGVILEADNTTVNASYVMTYHTILKTSQEYVDAIFWARRLAENITENLDLEVFPYSVFYVFYEQYLHTIHDMGVNLGASIGAVFVVTFITMGLNLWAAVIVMMAVVMVIIHMLGCMALAGISANAVSLVNLVMTVGISVEFVSHIVRWFTSCSLPTRYQRAYSALSHMGASVVSGITVTKFLGIFVLLFAKSQLFEIYYFRMYMFMLLWGALIGLVFLPVLLSYIGPPYCPVKNIPSPYDTSFIPPRQPESAPAYSTAPTPSKQPEYKSQYPSLPTSDEVENRINEQQYPTPTYPGQNKYQQRGIPYNTNVNENTSLLNH